MKENSERDSIVDSKPILTDRRKFMKSVTKVGATAAALSGGTVTASAQSNTDSTKEKMGKVIKKAHKKRNKQGREEAIRFIENHNWINRSSELYQFSVDHKGGNK